MKHIPQLQHVLRDVNLSLKAKGIFALLCELGEEIPAHEIALLTRDGETAIRSGLRELIGHGYLERVAVRDEHNPRWQTRIIDHE
jgi:hypothetical protein